MAIAANLVALGVLNAVVVGQMGMAAPEQVWEVAQKPAGYTNAVVSGLPGFREPEQGIHGYAGLPDGSWRR